MSSSTRDAPAQVTFRTIDNEVAGQRVDNYLLGALKGVPRAWVYRVIRKGEVRINKKRCKPETRLQAGDVLRVPPVRERQPSEPRVPGWLRESLQSAVVYEDENFLALNKPAGMAVHGGSGLSYGLIEGLREVFPNAADWELVHRLDRDTSGLLLVAKRRRTLLQLQKLLQEHRLEKRYHAWVHGQWNERVDEVSVPLKKNTLKSGERMVVVSQDGKQSLTKYRVLRRTDKATLVEASPVTGRTHQIRVHCQYAGHPIIGDSKYAPEDVNKYWREKGVLRMCLHASELLIRWPDQPEQLLWAEWEYENAWV